MRIVILTSWPLDVRLGSGVVRMLTGLQKGLRRLGYPTDIFHPQFDPTSFLNLANRRLQFNRWLRRRNLDSYDLIVGSDFDGYALNPKYNSRFYVFNGAILADILPFESGTLRRILAHLACREQQSMKKARKVFVPSSYAAGIVQKTYGLCAEKITVVPLGIDFKQWRELLQTAPQLPKNNKEILCVAKQYARKGISDLLRAFADIQKQFGDIHLTVVGNGPLYMKNKALAYQLGIGKAVTFTGDVSDRRQLASFYKRADLFCLPSYHETFGLVFLEAMAAGLPVVAYRAAAVQETVDNTCGILLNPGDIKGLARTIKRLLKTKPDVTQSLHKAQSMSWINTARQLLETLG